MARIYNPTPPTGDEDWFRASAGSFTFYNVVQVGRTWQVWRKKTSIGKPDIIELVNTYDSPGTALGLADWYNDAEVAKAANE